MGPVKVVLAALVVTAAVAGGAPGRNFLMSQTQPRWRGPVEPEQSSTTAWLDTDHDTTFEPEISPTSPAHAERDEAGAENADMTSTGLR